MRPGVLPLRCDPQPPEDIVNAPPRGESSSHITLPLEPMAEVAGRPMLGALEMLLGLTGCSAATRRNACLRYSPPAARIKSR